MPPPLVNRTLMAWFRRHFAARRTLGWHSQLGHKLKGIYPGRKYGGAWATTIITELEKGGIVGLTRDLLYKSLALASALTPEQITAYSQRGLTWSHMRVALVASSKTVVAEANMMSTRRKPLQELLDKATEQSWSVRRLQQVLAAKPSGRTTKLPKSRGWDADIARLTSMVGEWNKFTDVWIALAEMARDPARARIRRSTTVKTALVDIDAMLKSLTKMRDALAAD